MNVTQRDFHDAVLDPKSDRPNGLSDGTGQPAGRRFDVYRNNVAVSLTEALETAFPVITKLVGESNFKLLAGVFLRQHPPASPVLMLYGAEMPSFLVGFAPTQSIGYLPDVARLEQAMRESYHAADATPIGPALLQNTPPEALLASHVTLAPSVRLVRSSWPIYSVWAYNMIEGAPKPAMAAEDVIVLRADMDPEPTPLPPGGGAFVETILNGATFREAVDAGAAQAPDFDLTKVLSLLIGAGALTKLETSK